MKSPSDNSPARGDAAAPALTVPANVAGAAAVSRSNPDNAALRKVLEQARDFIDPDRDPPRINNRKLVMKINAVLSRVDAQRQRDPEVVAAVQRALMKHPHFTGGPQTAFGFANTAIDAYTLAMTSTTRRGPCEVCGQPADLCMSSLSGSKTWICVMCDPDSPTVDASREDGK